MIKRPTEAQMFDMLVEAYVEGIDPADAERMIEDHFRDVVSRMSDQEIEDELQDIGAFEQYEEEE